MIERLPLPISVKGVTSFLGHTSFYQRLTKDFSNIAHPLCKLLVKECKFYFYESCVKEFGELKEKLVSTPIIISLDWCKSFEVRCDACGVSLGVVLGQKRDKILYPFIMPVRP